MIFKCSFHTRKNKITSKSYLVCIDLNMILRTNYNITHLNLYLPRNVLHLPVETLLESSHLFFRPQPQSWGPIELGCPSVCLSVIAFLYGLELLNGRWYRLGYRLKWKVLVRKCAFWPFRSKTSDRKLSHWPK